MKKKLLLALACIMLASAFLFGFSACSEGGRTGTSVQLNVKYIPDGYVNAEEGERPYYMFTSSSRGRYFYYSKTTDSTWHYTIKFVYKIVGDSLVCFFDSVEYEDDHNGPDVSSDWEAVFSAADRDILVKKSFSTVYYSKSIYINENYLDEIPNFGK